MNKFIEGVAVTLLTLTVLIYSVTITIDITKAKIANQCDKIHMITIKGEIYECYKK